MVLPIEQYFDDMELTEEQKQKRVSFAYRMEDVIAFILAILQTEWSYGVVDKIGIKNRLYGEYRELVANFTDVDDYLQTHILKMADEIIDTTFKGLEKEEVLFDYGVFIGATTSVIKEYLLSVDRARLIAETEANSIFNYAEFNEAKRQGYTKKQWQTELDGKVRKTHRMAEGEIVDIDEPFNVGNSQMLFPHDESLGASAEEIVNCRCTIKYL